MIKNATLRIEIPSPCTEKWSEMQPVDALHRHCTSCDKVLTDFSAMSDTELALWFTHSKGKICGRFSPHQLSRDFTLPAAQPRPKYWLNALWLLPLSWFATDAKAQQPEVLKSKPVVSVPNGNVQPEITNVNADGDTLPQVIKGIVLDKESNEPLPFVNIYIKPEDGGRPVYGTVTDIDGKYSLKIPDNLRTKPFTLVFTYVGYDKQEIPVNNLSELNKLNGMPTMKVLLDAGERVLKGEIIIIQTPAQQALHRDSRSVWSKLRVGFGFGK